MPTTIGIQLEDYEEVEGVYSIILKNQGLIINDGGDTLTEVSNGYFEAEVSETLSQVVSYEVLVTKDDVKIYAGWLLLSRSNTVDDPGTGPTPTTLPEIDLTTFGKYGPKRVKTPNLEIEQFDPDKVIKADRMNSGTPSFCDSHICIAEAKYPFVNIFNCG